jgi:hypothetical protein
MGGLVMVETRLVGAMVVVVDWAILSEHMPATKHSMMKPAYPSPLWRI